MLTSEELAQLNEAHLQLERKLIELGRPVPDEIVQSALAGMTSPDRNQRVLMLRTLARYPAVEASTGILAGLNDGERRVRGVAIQSSRCFLHFPKITQCLAVMATDESEKRKIRRRALGVLSGVDGRPQIGTLPQPAVDELAILMGDEEYRQSILMGLLQIKLSPSVEELLQHFIQDGAEDEQKLATKALAGYKMVNLGLFDEPERSQIAQQCELAMGRVFYWVQR